MAYGIEVTSDTGYKMVLPSDNPFVFYTYVDIAVYSTDAGSGPTVHNVGIPATAKGLVFYRKLNGGNASVMVNESPGNLQLSVKWSDPVSGNGPCTVRIYVFTNTSNHTSSGNYGIQIYDANGQSVLTNNAKPLNIHRRNYPAGVGGANVGFPVAVMCSVVGWTFSPVTQPIRGCHMFAIVGSCLGSVIEGQTFWTGFLPNLAPQPDIINNTEALCIDYTLYE